MWSCVVDEGDDDDEDVVDDVFDDDIDDARPLVVGGEKDDTPW